VGQRIEVDGVTVVDQTIIVATNRSFTGTDGEGFGSGAEASASDTFPARLATDLFEADKALGRVYVDQNAIVISRLAVWSDDTIAVVRGVIESFFLFYPDA
jgi:hypothetical protein